MKVLKVKISVFIDIWDKMCYNIYRNFRRKLILRKNAAVLVLIILSAIVFAFGGCDNADYTEYGGEITSITGSDIDSVVSAYEDELEQKRVEKLEALASEEALTATSAVIMDRTGRLVEVPEDMKRIVSTSPAITEILAGLGLTDRIVAADMFSSDVPTIDKSVCTLDMMHIDSQAIADLSPDVVFVGEISGEEAIMSLQAMGIYTAFIPTAKSLEAIKMDIEFIAALTGTGAEGAELISEMNTEIFEVSEILGDITPKSVYFEIEEQPNICTVGSNTFLADLLNTAGAETVFADMDGYVFITAEDILERAEEIDIIFTTVSYDGYDPLEILDREGFDGIKALQDERFYSLNPNSYLRPSHNITKELRALAQMIHPDMFMTE
jgi:iron complex transport system substrate-binding protein